MRSRFKSINYLLAGIVLALLPLFAANIFMHQYVASHGRTVLERATGQSLKHAESLIQEAIDVFSVLPHYNVPVCNEELQARFRRMILRHAALHDVGLVFNGEFMYCSSIQESARFYPISESAKGDVDHLSYVAVKDGETEKYGLLVQWYIADQTSIGGFILVDDFQLDSKHVESFDLFHKKISLANGAVVVESSPKSRLLKRAPFARVDHDPAWSKDLIEYEIASTRYPIIVSNSVPYQAVWGTLSGVMNMINGLCVLIGALIMFFFVRLALRKPTPTVTIAEGIKRREFIPYYQPVIDIQTGRLAGCEVLVRWRKQDGTILPPGHFIGLAEDTGLARPMTSLLMEQVAQDLSEAYRQNNRLKVSINLFNRHFDDLAIVDEVEQIFGNSGIRFEQLVFEITERHPLHNLDRARAIIARMQALGARVALDDAGTGHGGFAYLQKLGMDIIKIDKLFVDTINGNSVHVPIVDSLSQMAKGLDMLVIAEGVETEEQLVYLRNQGIDQAQGYLFAPPLPAKAYLELASALVGENKKEAEPLISIPEQDADSVDALDLQVPLSG